MNQAESKPLSDLVIGLSDPGMTPLLRAGLGGLAASLYAMLRKQDPEASWPSPIALGPGLAIVTPRSITIQWNNGAPEDVLRPLFEASFQISGDGVISLPGTWKHPPGLAVASALQLGLKRTFLQHGSAVKKLGAPELRTVEIDDKQIAVEVQRHSSFRHQSQVAKIVKALQTGAVAFAGWAYPGAAERHSGLNRTNMTYDARLAMCCCFAVIGCTAWAVPRAAGGGALAIVEPSDLVRFAMVRSQLSPRTIGDAYAVCLGDAVLATHLALKMSDLADNPGVRTVHGVILGHLPWDKRPKQKYRMGVVSLDLVDESVLSAYHDARRALPSRYHIQSAVDDEDDKTSGAFVTTSVLRAFVTDNIAHGRRWYQDFATATSGGKKPRFIHYYRDRDRKNLGALYPEEKKGLLVMLKHMEEAESILVSSVHTALRQRLGAIAKECEKLPKETRNKRWSNERDKWRFAFSGAKTPDQIRAALADLWSRAGTVRELRSGWQQVLPLLREGQWRTARDLALVALASYQREDDADADS